MLGTKAHPKLRAKAAETFGLLLFVTDLLRDRAVEMGAEGALLLDAGECLCKIMEILQTSPVNISVRQVEVRLSWMFTHARIVGLEKKRIYLVPRTPCAQSAEN